MEEDNTVASITKQGPQCVFCIRQRFTPALLWRIANWEGAMSLGKPQLDVFRSIVLDEIHLTLKVLPAVYHM